MYSELVNMYLARCFILITFGGDRNRTGCGALVSQSGKESGSARLVELRVVRPKSLC